MTAASDLYSLGCVLYELLTGRTPYAFKTLAELLVKHREEDIPPVRELRPEVSDRLEAAVMHALARDPDYRPESAAALAEELAIASPEPPTRQLPRATGHAGDRSPSLAHVRDAGAARPAHARTAARSSR